MKQEPILVIACDRKFCPCSWSLTFVGMKIANLEVAVTGDKPFGLDSQTPAFMPATNVAPFIIMANHQSYVDTFFLTYWLHTLNMADGMEHTF
jgi:1-acyl-sn-glycerol-3-phosphate acyltransferase